MARARQWRARSVASSRTASGDASTMLLALIVGGWSMIALGSVHQVEWITVTLFSSRS